MSNEHSRRGQGAPPPDSGAEGPDAGSHQTDEAMPAREIDAPGAMTGMPGHEGMGAEPGGMEGMAHGLATPWAHFFAAILLGAWLMTSPVSLGYEDEGQTWSDIVSGALIIVFANARATAVVGALGELASWRLAPVCATRVRLDGCSLR